MNPTLSEGDVYIDRKLHQEPYIKDKEIGECDFDLTLYTCTKDNLNRLTVRLNRIN